MPEISVVRLKSTERPFDLAAMVGALKESNIDVERFGEEEEQHVVLRCRAPWVKERGYLNFIGNWHYWSEPPGDHADWVRAIAPASAGKVEIWMLNLTPGAQYVAAIEVSSWGAGPSAAFEIRSSDAAGSLEDALTGHQVLLTLFEPQQSISLMSVEPHDLESWTFQRATISIL